MILVLCNLAVVDIKNLLIPQVSNVLVSESCSPTCRTTLIDINTLVKIEIS